MTLDPKDPRATGTTDAGEADGSEDLDQFEDSTENDLYSDDGTDGSGGGAPEDADDPETLKALLAAEKRKTAQLLSEKSSGEEARREVRELRQMVDRLQSGGAQSKEDEDRLRALVNAVSSDDDPRSQFLMELAKELHATQLQLAKVQQEGKFRIPTKDRAEVDRMMATGRFADKGAAYEAVLGRRYRAQLRAQQEAGGGDPNGASKDTRRSTFQRKDEPQRPVSTGPRPVTKSRVDALDSLKTIPQSQYRDLVAKHGQALVNRVRNNLVKVVPG
jgi:hypothetical protein